MERTSFLTDAEKRAAVGYDDDRSAEQRGHSICNRGPTAQVAPAQAPYGKEGGEAAARPIALKYRE
jgi:hypothetical protein